MPSLSAGLLLGAALLYALPQAFESTADKRGLCATLLAGLLLFFLLEKWATLRRAQPSATGLAGHRASAVAVAAAFNARPAGGWSRRRFDAGKLLCSSLAAAAGLASYLAFERSLAWTPHVLVLAASGFLYIALSELVPKIQQPASNRDTAVQLLLLGIGVTLVLYLPGLRARS